MVIGIGHYGVFDRMEHNNNAFVRCVHSNFYRIGVKSECKNISCLCTESMENLREEAVLMVLTYMTRERNL